MHRLLAKESSKDCKETIFFFFFFLFLLGKEQTCWGICSVLPSQAYMKESVSITCMHVL